jgi:hypothetical protein
MISTFISERCSDLPVSTCCRVMKVSTSGHYQRVREPITDAELIEAYRANIVFDIWKRSRHSYGMPLSVGSSARVATRASPAPPPTG